LQTKTGKEVYLSDVWPTSAEIREVEESVIEAGRCRDLYTEALKGDEQWQALETSPGALFTYDTEST
jgi:aconitate hydratase